MSADLSAGGIGTRFAVIRGSIVLIEKCATPVLDAQQRPDEEPPVYPPLQMIVEQPPHHAAIEILVDPGLIVAEHRSDVVDALAAEPARVGCREAFFHSLRYRLRYVALHGLAQQQLAVTGPLVEGIGLVAG